MAIRYGAPGTKGAISHTCSVYVMHILFVYGFRKCRTRNNTSGDDSRGCEDDCCSKTKADRWYRNHEEDDDDDN